MGKCNEVCGTCFVVDRVEGWQWVWNVECPESSGGCVAVACEDEFVVKEDETGGVVELGCTSVITE